VGDVTDLTGRRNSREHTGTRRMLGDRDKNHPPRKPHCSNATATASARSPAPGATTNPD
jgi:hypothetical protein